MVLLFGITSLQAQQRPAPPAPPSAPRPAQAVVKQRSGVRFVVINDVPVTTVYMPTMEGVFKKMTLRSGLPGERVAYPENGKIIFYDQQPIPNANQKLTPILSSPLPDNKSEKLLCLIGSANNKMYIIYIDETNLKYGTVLFKNMTGKDYLVDMPTAPAGEEKRFLLKGGTEHLFGRNSLPPENTNTYKAVFMHLIQPEGAPEAKWYPERKCMVTSYGRRSQLCLLVPNADGTEMQMQQIILFPESNQAGEENTRR